MQIVIPNVDVATVEYRSHQIDPFVHAAAQTMEQLRGWGSMGTQKRAALHPGWRRDPRQAQRRRAQVHKRHQAIRHSTRHVTGPGQFLPSRRDVNHQGDVQPRVIGTTFAPGHAGAVIAVIENDGVLRQAGCCQLVQHPPRLGVHLRHFVIILGPVLTHLRPVRMIRRNPHPGGVVHRHVRASSNLALVRGRQVKDREERLPWSPVAIMSSR